MADLVAAPEAAAVAEGAAEGAAAAAAAAVAEGAAEGAAAAAAAAAAEAEAEAASGRQREARLRLLIRSAGVAVRAQQRVTPCLITLSGALGAVSLSHSRSFARSHSLSLL